jgi:hypothetical protein
VSRNLRLPAHARAWTLYQIRAQVVSEVAGWRSSVGVPTFMVPASSPADAAQVARLILVALTTTDVVALHYTVMPESCDAVYAVDATPRGPIEMREI